MKKTFFITLFSFFIIATAFCTEPCKDGEHEYYKYKCTICGSLQPVEDQFSGDYAYVIRSDYDEWGEEIGKCIIIQTENAIYRNEYGEEEDILVQLMIKPTTKSITIGFYDTNGTALYGTYQSEIRYRTGNGNIYNINEDNMKWDYINEVRLFDLYTLAFDPFISNLLSTNKIKVLLDSPARIEFTIEYDNIILSRMLEECGADFFWDLLGENIIFSSDITKLPDCRDSFKDSSFNIIIPDSVTVIEEDAFNGCTGLTGITIPDSVTIIGDSAFERCTGLTEITIPDSVTEIGFYAFRGCTGLTSIIIPNSVKKITETLWGYGGGGIFNNCINLTDIYCEAPSKPDGWDSDWNSGCNATVHWGYTGETNN